MAAATTTTRGTIKLGGDLAGSTNADAPELIATGTSVGAFTNPNLTVDAKGRVIAITSGSSIDIFALPVASASSPGYVSVGSGLTITSGSISPAIASTSDAGIFQVGTGLAVTAGVVRIDTALYITTANGGTFTGALATTPIVASVTGSTTLNFTSSNVYRLTLTGNITFNLPSPILYGGVYFVEFVQDGTGSRIMTWDSAFKFETGSPTTLSTAPNAKDMARIIALSSTELLVKLYKDFA